MTIELYGHRNFKGNSVEIRNNVSDMKHTELKYRTSSMKLLDHCDTVLIFNGHDWHGDAMWRKGVARMGDMGEFNNKVRSIRIHPFKVNVKYHVIYKKGDLPGPDDTGNSVAEQLLDLARMAKHVCDMHEIVKDIWHEYLLNMEMVSEISWVRSGKYFSMNADRNELTELQSGQAISLPRDCINVVLVDEVTVGGAGGTVNNALGIGPHGLTVPLAVVEVIDKGAVFQNGRTAAHEIGHVLGLGHGGNCDPVRLMTQTGKVMESGGTLEDAIHLSREEIELVHTNLAVRDVSDDLTGNMFELRKE